MQRKIQTNTNTDMNADTNTDMNADTNTDKYRLRKKRVVVECVCAQT